MGHAHAYGAGAKTGLDEPSLSFVLSIVAYPTGFLLLTSVGSWIVLLLRLTILRLLHADVDVDSVKSPLHSFA